MTLNHANVPSNPANHESEFLPNMFGDGCFAPVWSKKAPQNGSCVQDATDTAIADQCRSLLICSDLRHQQAPAASIA